MSARDRLLDLFLHGGNGSQPEFEAALDDFEAETRPAERPVNETLVKAREAAAAVFEAETDGRRPMWRVIITDSESPTGVAPVCTAEGDDDLHLWANFGHGIERVNDGVWDCCPWPQIETDSPAVAEYLVELLNADADASEKSTREGEATHEPTQAGGAQ